MNITYIHHSCFLVETDRFYYLFDYAKGHLPRLDTEKPIFVLSSHSHSDHYSSSVFQLLETAGMRHVRAILSDDITPPSGENVLQVSPAENYDLGCNVALTTFRSTDLGVAFLIEDQKTIIYHAGDLNDWVWNEETDDYNREMTANYRREIDSLSRKLGKKEIDAAFVVLDPRQEQDYDRGLCYFLDKVPAKQVYPMHYWEEPAIIGKFLKDHPQYTSQIQKTE